MSITQNVGFFPEGGAPVPVQIPQATGVQLGETLLIAAELDPAFKNVILL